MLNRQQLKDYRLLRGLTQRDVEQYCGISQTLIRMIETGDRNITQENHDEIIKGINAAYEAKKLGKIPPKKLTSRKKKEVSPDEKY